MEERKIEAVTESPTSLDGLAIEQRTPMPMERKIEDNPSLSVEQLLRQKIVELESKVITDYGVKLRKNRARECSCSWSKT